MLGRDFNRQNSHARKAGKPLLNAEHDNLPGQSNDAVLFSINDDDDDGDGHVESSALTSYPEGKGEHAVRFQEDVQVIGPPLRSTYESRETGVFNIFGLGSL